jgi:hypothetical protein
MLWSGLRFPLLWVGAQLGTLLASLDEPELRRFAIKQQAWWVPLWISSLCGAYLAGAIGPSGWVPYLILSAPLLFSLRWRATLVNAGLDRTSTPIAAGGRVRILIPSRDGGWPLLLRDQDDRWLWLTGQEQDLDRVRQTLRKRRSGVGLELRLTLTYYPRTHVIKEITGMSVQEREPVRAPARQLATNPA